MAVGSQGTQCPDGHTSTSTDYCDECGLAIGGSAAVAPSASAGSVASVSTHASVKGEPCPQCLLPRTDDPFCEGCGFDFATETELAATVSAPANGMPGSVVPVNAAPVNATGTATGLVPTPSLDPALASATEIELVLDLDAELAAAFAAVAPAAASAAAPAPTAPAPDRAATGTWVAVATADRAYYDSVVAEGEIDPNAYPFPPYCPERRFAVEGDTVRVGRGMVQGSTVEIDLTGPPKDPGVSHLHAVLQATPDGGWTVLDPGSTNGTVLNDDTAPIPENHPVAVGDGYRIHVGVWTTLTLTLEG